MNNLEKRKYITDLLISSADNLMCFFALQDCRLFIENTPKTLYKYRIFDKFTFDMIDKNYVYLAPANKLDDPFDCVTNFDSSKYISKNPNRIKANLVELVTRIVSKYRVKKDLHASTIRKYVKDLFKNGHFDYQELPKILYSNGVITREQVEPCLLALEALFLNENQLMQKGLIEQDFKTMFESKMKTGVFCLSEERDNKVMWSLYAGIYKGYCIEYEIPKTKEIINSLYPVLYSKKSNNDFLKNEIEFLIAVYNLMISEGRIVGNIGARVEAYCSKDKDWSYQKEWRILGKPDTHLEGLRIKSIFLGFDIESSMRKEMLQRATKYGFDLYQMDKPKGNKKITYTKIS